MTDMRRNADGSLDIDHYRRRARRLRQMARRRAWVALRRTLAELCGCALRHPGVAAARIGEQRA
jgi:hypothetical protein